MEVCNSFRVSRSVGDNFLRQISCRGNDRYKLRLTSAMYRLTGIKISPYCIQILEKVKKKNCISKLLNHGNQ